MRKVLFISIWLVLALTSASWAQSYNDLWKKVETFQKKDLPKSVVESALVIFDKAKREHQAPQMMKAYLTMTYARNRISPDSLASDLKFLEEWARTASDSTDAAVLRSVLSELYVSQSVDKALDYAMASIRPVKELEGRSARTYVPLAVLGETSRKYEGDNLYPVLVRRVLSFLQNHAYQLRDKDGEELLKRTYRELLDFYTRKGYREAYVLCYLNAMNANTSFRQPNIYQHLIAAYGDVETCAEVYLEYAGRMSNRDEALDSLRSAERRYRTEPFRSKIKNEMVNLTDANLSLRVNDMYPGVETDIEVFYKYLTDFTLNIYRTDVRDIEKIMDYRSDDSYWKGKWTLYRTKKYHLQDKASCNSLTKTYKVMIPEEGYYLFELRNPGGRQEKSLNEPCLVFVSSLGMIFSPISAKTQHAWVIDRLTGKPIPHAHLDFYNEDMGVYKKSGAGMDADDNGFLSWNSKERADQIIRATTADHPFMPIRYMRGGYLPTYMKTVNRLAISLFSDRTIYRPGQQIYVSGLVFNNNPDSLYCKENVHVRVKLLDANRKQVSETTLVTNDFGSFQTSFSLPKVCLPGNFTVVAGVAGSAENRMGVKVEAYKRPLFEVKIDPIAYPYKMNDTLRITGSATLFTGVPVQQAEVKYRVSKIPVARNSFGKTQLQEDTVYTDSVGRFQFDIIPSAINQIGSLEYVCEVDVTTGAGDTQSCTKRIAVKDVSYRLMADVSSLKWIKERPQSILFKVLNMDNQPQNTQVKIDVFELSGGLLQLEAGKCVYSQRVESNTRFLPTEIYQLPSGYYRIKYAVDDGTRIVSDSLNIGLIALTDKKMPAGTDLFVYNPNTHFDSKGVGEVYIGTSFKDATVYYSIYTAMNRIISGTMQLSDTLSCISYPYKEEYGDFIRISYALVNNDKPYYQNTFFSKPTPDKTLVLQWQTFRDKLQPGGKEEWRLKVTDAKGQPVVSELLATLYDASLDKLYPRNSWRLNLARTYPLLSLPSPHVYLSDSRYIRYHVMHSSALAWTPFSYTDLDIVFDGYIRMGAMPLLSKSVAVAFRGKKATGNVMLATAEASVAFDRAPAMAPADNGGSEEIGEIEEESDQSKVEFRENFAETAFFYPQLRSNSNGEISMVFTLPESLTTWRLMGLAHAKDMSFGAMDTTVIARKDFMLQTNLPRFVRVGDRTSLVGTLSNVSGKAVKGTVRLELFDPMTDKVFYTDKQLFRMEDGKTVPVSFSYEVSDKYTLIGCRMTADGGMFSDGEQHLLPVLSRKEWITESVSVSMNEAGTKTVALDSLFNHQSATATHRRLTVEFTGNPAWLAVMSLPSIGTPSNNNAISLSAAVYSSSLASWIVNQYPQIRKMFESWKQQGEGSKDLFLSELQKNEELKDLLLENSPFLLDAKNETEQRNRLATLFDLNTLQNQISLYMDRLNKLQKSDGGWSWFEGMHSNVYVTMSVVETLLRLRSLTAMRDADAMLTKAVGYLDDLAVKEYDWLRKHAGKQASLSEFASHYLYIRTLSKDRDRLGGNAQKAYAFFMKLLKDDSVNRTIYGKAVAAIVLAENKEHAAKAEYLKSLLEYSVYTPEMGRYYDTKIAWSSWADYKIPMQSMVIEALRRCGVAQEEVRQMQQWLLKQKQMQSWDTPVNTVNAVYALLVGNASILDAQPMPGLMLDKRPISTENASLGLNSVKETFSLHDDERLPRSFTVTKSSDGVSWGAVYAQYSEDMEKLSTHSEGLSVVRKLYVERMVNGRSNWVELKAGTPLKVGEKLKAVMTIKADRDMDFVQLKESRASCLEPVAVISGYSWNWKSGIGYYRAIKDASMEYYMDKMRKGTCTIESLYHVTLEGVYEMGSVKVQSAYSPEFNGHTGGTIIQVKK